MVLTLPAAPIAVIEASPGRPVGVASGALNAARQAGGAIGVALLGTLISGAFVPGMHAAMAVSAGAFLLAALVTSVTVGPRQRGARRPLVRRLSS
jgi:DHA2 family methylenomycin A resistance protein-like MFS transporter